MTELDWINKAKLGEIQYFGFLTEKYAKMCFSVAYNVVKNYDDANDIVQDAMISAFENLTKYKGDAKFSTWIYRIVFNQSLAFKKRQRMFFEINDKETTKPIDEKTFDEELEKKFELLPEAIEQLSEQEKLIIQLFYYQNQSINDISTICSLSESNTKVILYRARKKIFELLKK